MADGLLSPEEEAIISGGGTTTTGPTLIGLPPGTPQVVRPYDATNYRSGLHGGQGRAIPLYYTTDLLTPSRNWSTPQRLNWQLAMVEAGLLDPEDLSPGVWYGQTQTAYRNVLEYANQSGLTKEEALLELAQNPTLGARRGSGAGSGSGRSVTLVHPADLQAVANEVAPSVIGRRFTDEEVAKFVSSFHGAQAGGNPPSPDVAAEQLAKEIDPTAAEGRSLADVFGVVFQMMQGNRAGG